MMIKLNAIHYPLVKDLNISKEYSLDILKNNELYLEKEKEFLKKYSFSLLKTFSYTKDGFLSLLLELKNQGDIAISLGETNALVEAGKIYETLGFKIFWIDLQKEGQINFEIIEKLDLKFLFVSSYIMDTFVQTNLEKIKQFTNAKIISNATIESNSFSDAIYFDPYKLTGFNTNGVFLSNGLVQKQSIAYIDTVSVYNLLNALEKKKSISTPKNKFKIILEELFGDDLYYFVDPDTTFDFTFHFALKYLKARELIRTLALDEILVTNGEGCSLGLSQPSKIIQAMGYEEEISRNGISLSFVEELSDEKIEKTCKIIHKRYKQIRVLS